MIEINGNRRPIYGVLTEPLRGDMQKNSDKNETETSKNWYKKDEMEVSYIPKAHVQFLEQSGIRVVPISYMLDNLSLVDMLSKVNGIYLAGDSHKSIMNS